MVGGVILGRELPKNLISSESSITNKGKEQMEGRLGFSERSTLYHDYDFQREALFTMFIELKNKNVHQTPISSEIKIFN